MVSVMRLKNAPKGEPYAIERIDGLTMDAAAKLATSWWESRGTLSLIVMDGDIEDSRYTKEYADAERVPEAWPKGKAPPPRPKPLEQPAKVKAPERAPPTLFNAPVRPNETRVKCTGCQRQVTEGRPRPDEAHASRVCGVCGVPFSCTTCLMPLPMDGYPGDNEPTPSGRLADLRCPECGSPQRGVTGRQLWDRYTRGKR